MEDQARRSRLEQRLPRAVRSLPAPATLLGHWQTRSDKTQAATFELGADIVQYAVDKHSLRLQGRLLHRARRPEDQARKGAEAGEAQYDGNWDPEPGGWRRMAAVLRNQFKFDLQVEAVMLGEGLLTKAAAGHPAGHPPFGQGTAEGWR